MKGSYLGPSYSNNEIENILSNLGAKYEVLNDENLIDRTASDLSMAADLWFPLPPLCFGQKATASQC